MTIDLDALEWLAKSCEQDNWVLQTSCSWRRIGTTRDGNILCPTNHRIDGHPDLAAASNVLEFIVAAQPRVVVGLIQRLREAELDAARYRWLRHGDNDEDVLRDYGSGNADVYLLRGELLDEAIDQQRKIATGEDLGL